MKKNLLFIIIFAVALQAAAQQKTGGATVYKQFKPATIQLASGQIVRQPLANIFLKNSSLLYMSHDRAMEANMKNILAVTFDDRKYVKIDSVLAYVVDSLNGDVLYKATVIDLVSYKANLLNNRNITSLDLGEQISYSNVDISNEDDFLFPLVDLYYYRYHGQFVRVHERNLSRIIPKEKRRLMKTLIGQEAFSWTDEKSLMELLKWIQ